MSRPVAARDILVASDHQMLYQTSPYFHAAADALAQMTAATLDGLALRAREEDERTVRARAFMAAGAWPVVPPRGVR